MGVTAHRQGTAMRNWLPRALKTYLVVSLVMLINAALAVGLLWVVVLVGTRTMSPSFQMTSWEEIPGLKEAKGDRALIAENLDRLNLLCQKGLHANLRTLLKHCGKPDGYCGDMHGDLQLLYSLDPAGAKGRTGNVDLKGGFVVGLSYMDSAADGVSGYKQWDIQGGDIPSYR